MSDNRAAFIQRVISAVAAGLILLGIGIYGGAYGLSLAVTIVIILSIREYTRMAFRLGQMPTAVSHAYWAVCLLTYLGLIYFSGHELVAFGIGNAAFFAASLWLTRGRVTNEALLASVAIGAFGLVYVVLFPYFCVRLLQLPGGLHWFLFMLLVVFSGDTFAYFAGRWFGKRKFMPMISPKKTWAGSVGGLIGSATAGTVYLCTLGDYPVPATIVFCIVCGFAAQTGDLLMSLVKRVAQVKDSGTIMPGHGGILDRIDGVLIACPLVYAYALYLRPLVSE
jgi:phosphatidate cytidylyltransferase